MEKRTEKEQTNTKKVVSLQSAFIALGIILLIILIGGGFFRFFFYVLPWWLALQIITAAGFVYAFHIFRSLPDKGWGIAKFLGLLLLTYLAWIIASVRIIPYSVGLLLFVLLLLGGGSAILLWKKLSWRNDIVTFIKSNRTYIILIEGLFLFTFLLFVNIRSYCPEITFEVSRHAAEKFLNFEVLNTLYRAKYFPPLDTWLSGYTTNYYYFGHLLWATMGKFSGYPSQVAFNLGLASLFALTFMGGFSLGYNVTRKLGFAVLTGFFMVMAGNVLSLLDFLNGLRFGLKLDYIFNAGYLWNASRVIAGTITEFPAFTALLGDLHAHHSGLMTIILGLTALLNLFLWRNREESRVENTAPSSGTNFVKKIWEFIGFRKDYLLTSVFLGWIAGAAYVINSWDIITISTLFALAMLIKTREIYKHSTRRWIIFSAVCILLIASMSKILYHPFHANFKNPLPMEIRPHILPWKIVIKQFPLAWLSPTNRTYFTDYFVHFGFFLLPIYLWLFFKLKDSFKTHKQWKYFLITLLAVLIIFSLALFQRMLPGFLAFIMVCSIILLFRENGSQPVFRWLILLLIVATFYSIFCEFLYFDDRYSGELERYNTPFKFYNPMWIMYSVLAGWAWWQLFQLAESTKKRIQLSILLGLVVIASSIYFFGGTVERTDRFFRRPNKQAEHLPNRSLDGMAYLGIRAQFKDDYQVLKWAKENIKGQPTVLEAVGGPYTAYSRFSTNTGLPTLVGWGHHEAQQRGDGIYTDKFGEMILADENRL